MYAFDVLLLALDSYTYVYIGLRNKDVGTESTSRGSLAVSAVTSNLLIRDIA
jgi:hypothetical protein